MIGTNIIKLLLVLPLLASVVVYAKQKKRKMEFASNPVVAHRGAFKANGFPENSIASLREAIRLGCTGSEFDVHMTADDTLVINHDAHFHGLEIEKSSYAELSSFKLSNGESLPTLRQYLQEGMHDNRQTRLVLEIKPSGLGSERAEKVVDAVVDLVKELKAEPYMVYISFDYKMMLRLKKLLPKAPLQYLNGEKSPEELKADGINGIDYHFAMYDAHADWAERAKKEKLALNAWTVNDPVIMDKLLNLGFDFITTNEPELLLKKWKERGSR
jgi:glycerophosphoryl diester phosphodiesterase